jgi:outer membrane protein assembly factor BamB
MACQPGFKLVLVLFIGCTLGLCSDWVTARGDAQRTGCQLNEKTLSLHSVKRLHLLWNKPLGADIGLMTDPLILGPFITHRGIKELVLARNSTDGLYAIDADLGTLFWTRSLRQGGIGTASHPSCPNQRVTPAMSTPPVAVKSKALDDDEEFSDGSRPIYVFATDATLYAIRPSNGEDVYLPLQLFPPCTNPSDLKVVDSVASVNSSTSCGKSFERRWTIKPDTDGRHLNASLLPDNTETSGHEQSASTTFNWKGEQVVVTLTRDNRLLLRNASSDHLLCRSEISASGAVLGLATAENNSGKRYVYVASSNSIAAYVVAAASRELRVEPIWQRIGLAPIGAPVVANGVVYALVAVKGMRPESTQLQAFNAQDGTTAYSSDPVPADRLRVTDLALANGHIVFGTGDGVLHCFGFPVDL